MASRGSNTGLMVGLAVAGSLVILVVALLVLGVGAGVGVFVYRGGAEEVPDIQAQDWEDDEPEVAEIAPEIEDIEAEDDWEPPPPPPVRSEPSAWHAQPEPSHEPSYEPATEPSHEPAPSTGGSMVRPTSGSSLSTRPDPQGSMVRPSSAQGTSTESTVRVTPAGTMVRPTSDSSTESTISVRPDPEASTERTTPAGSMVGPTGPAPSQDVVIADASCDDLRGLELTASQGKLSPGQWGCLDARKHDSSETPTQRMKVARVMLADAQTRCSVLNKSCADFHEELRYYIHELDRSDADILYNWLLVLYKNQPQTETACEELIWWADQTLTVRQQWPPGDVFVERTSRAYHIRGSAAYTRFQLANKAYLASREPEDLEHEDLVRGEARDYVLEWLQFNRRAELETRIPWEMCVTLAKESDVCGDRP